MFVNQAKKKGMFNNNINDRQSSPTDRCDSMNRDLIMRMNGYKQRDVKRTSHTLIELFWDCNANASRVAILRSCV